MPTQCIRRRVALLSHMLLYLYRVMQKVVGNVAPALLDDVAQNLNTHLDSKVHERDPLSLSLE